MADCIAVVGRRLALLSLSLHIEFAAWDTFRNILPSHFTPTVLVHGFHWYIQSVLN